LRERKTYDPDRGRIKTYLTKLYTCNPFGIKTQFKHNKIFLSRNPRLQFTAFYKAFELIKLDLQKLIVLGMAY